MTANKIDVRLIRTALEHLPARCKYHGDQIENTSWMDTYNGACCATGETALERRRALAALERIAT